ncbi:MAG: response regulator transcription factor [Chitinophagaceae bacterium]|nr:response regulator transcription factor [Chitinophagaceae bacterium]MCW5928334.1 response regulator transcription factor [Chitinophagaceae bacterium]
MRVQCLIVDDEPIARDIVQLYCSHLPLLSVTATAPNALEARKILQEEDIDLLFLDINMPALDGIAFLKTLKKPPQVILTTAYKEYALDAFDLAVCDYLLKPFSLDRFIVAVDKALEKIGAGTYEKTGIKDHAFIKADGKIFNIRFSDLLFAEASGNYTRLYIGSGMIMPAMTFAGIEAILPKEEFLRVHRSFIVNKSRISHVEGNRVFIQQKEIPIGSSYKNDFMAALRLG